MLYGIVGGGIFLFFLVVLVLRFERQGAKMEQNDQMQEVLDDIHTVSLARDRLRHDSDDAERVRERFTR